MSTWVIIFLIVAILPYLAVPILVWYTHRFAVQPSLRQLFPDFLPAPIKEAFQNISAVLQEESFSYCCDAVCDHHSQSLRLFFRTFIHPTREIFAVATAWVYDGQEPKTPDVEFISQFGDEVKLITHNSGLISAPIRSPKEISRTMTSIKSVRQLFQVHLFYLHELAKKKKVLLFEAEEGLRFLAKNLEAELVTQARMGGLFLEASTQQYRPTWAGAFLMAWYNMWPIALLRRFYHHQRAKIWLKRLSSQS